MADGFLATTATDTGVPFFAPGMAFTDSVLFIGDGGKNLTHTKDLEGYYNTGVGLSCMEALTTASYNTGVGFEVMFATTTGCYNSAFGEACLAYNITGKGNTSVGWKAKIGIPPASGGVGTGDYNTSVGYGAAINLDVGSNNISIGNGALGGANPTGSGNISIGLNAGSWITTGCNNIMIGENAGGLLAIGSGNLIIGPAPLGAAVSNTIMLSDGEGYTRFVADQYSVRFFNAATTSETLDVSDAGNVTFYGDAQLKSWTVAGLAGRGIGVAGSMIYVSDATGGGVPAFSDGTHWRSVIDRSVIA